MTFLTQFESHLPTDLRKTFQQLDSPFAIQSYLDSMPYIGEERDRSPLNVMLDGQAHCLDGGFLAALCLWRIGFKPLLIDLVPEPDTDDDHILALYQREGHWGAVAKSNFVNLGFREPIYRSMRELVISYFEHYFNTHHQKTLAGYTRPFDASRYTQLNWAWDEDSANILYHKRFYGRKAIPLLRENLKKYISPVTERAYKAETLYTNLDEAFGNRL